MTHYFHSSNFVLHLAVLELTFHSNFVQKIVTCLRIIYLLIIRFLFMGALKQGPCMCSTFKAFNLTYLLVPLF